MSDQPRAERKTDEQQTREMLAARARQLFGDERAEAIAADIDAVAAALERVNRLSPPDFSGLDPAERG